MRMRYLLHHVGIWRTLFYWVLLFCFCSPLFWNGSKIELFTIYYFHHFFNPNVYLTLTLSEFEILNDVALYIQDWLVWEASSIISILMKYEKGKIRNLSG